MSRSNSPRFLSGFLLEWPGGHLRTEHLRTSPGFTLNEKIGTTQWEQGTYSSQHALNGEQGISGPFRYEFICRRSGARLVLLSITKDVVDELIRSMSQAMSPVLRKVPIDVDELVRQISKRPTKYVLSFVHARTPAFLSSLKAISFFGEDLGEASYFKDNIQFMNFSAGGLRLAAGGEVIRLGGDGAVSFMYHEEPKRLFEIEKALSYLRDNGYLLTDIIREGDNG
jgi:hypothetical protein